MKGEVVYIHLVEVGRYIDLKRVVAVFPGKPDVLTFETKDTPIIYLPKPLALDQSEMTCGNDCQIKKINVKIKLYEDGVVSFIARLAFEDLTLQQIDVLHKHSFTTSDGTFNIEQWVDRQFDLLYPTIKPFIDEDYYIVTPLETESYTVFCISEDLGNPEEYVKKNASLISNLLMEINLDQPLHQSQIDATLGHPFAFLQNDLTIFDFDRCIIFDPRKHYEDTLYIAELANYQMLNLRCIDRMLDKRLDVAEDDIRETFVKSKNPFRKLTKKLGEWLKLRYDMLFILENLENVSKIIGNFHLGNQYKHLCSLFELDHWSTSIRNRLETLGDIYSLAHSDVNDRVILYIEIILAVIFIWEFVMAIIQFR